jgi:hypothetical protein
LISASVQLVLSSREEFAVGMEHSGCRSALLWGEGPSDAEPREGEFHGGHRGAEPVGGGAILPRYWLLGLTLSAAR